MKDKKSDRGMISFRAVLVGAILIGVTVVGASVIGRSTHATRAPNALRQSPGENNAEASAIQWFHSLNQGLSEARKSGKLVVVDFYANWCGPCQMMEKTTFRNPQVGQTLANGFVAVKINTDKQHEAVRKYGVQALPTTLVLDSQGNHVLGEVGYLDSNGFLKLLETAGQIHKKHK